MIAVMPGDSISISRSRRLTCFSLLICLAVVPGEAWKRSRRREYGNEQHR